MAAVIDLIRDENHEMFLILWLHIPTLKYDIFYFVVALRYDP
jgi:hypothetical protein